jgi:hypothetical protein
MCPVSKIADRHARFAQANAAEGARTPGEVRLRSEFLLADRERRGLACRAQFAIDDGGRCRVVVTTLLSRCSYGLEERLEVSTLFDAAFQRWHFAVSPVRDESASYTASLLKMGWGLGSGPPWPSSVSMRVARSGVIGRSAWAIERRVVM